MSIGTCLFLEAQEVTWVQLYPFVDAKESPVDDETLCTWVTEKERERLTRARDGPPPDFSGIPDFFFLPLEKKKKPEPGFVQAMEFWKNWNFEKEIPYMEKLWNFRFGGKNACFLLRKVWGKYVRTSKCGFNVCCLGKHFTRPSSTNLPGYSASLSLDRVNCYC